MSLPTTTITRCTTRLLCGPRGGPPVSVGTGFYYQSPDPREAQKSVLLIVTNKHVTAGHQVAEFSVASVPQGTDPDVPPPPGAVEHHRMTLSLQSPLMVEHPDPAIDLCALICTSAISQVMSTGRQAFVSLMNPGILVPLSERSIVRYVERVAMVGYPNGLWDEVNDLPIVRQGSTATHPFIPYRGRREFVVDMACLPGSSGSPVFLFEDGFYRGPGGGMTPGTKIALLGVLWGGPQISIQGKLEAVPAPHAVSAIPVTSFPMNLGFVVQADAISALEAEVHRMLATEGSTSFPAFGSAQ